MEKILIYNKQFINYDQSQEMLILTITKYISINCFTPKTRVLINLKLYFHEISRLFQARVSFFPVHASFFQAHMCLNENLHLEH